MGVVLSIYNAVERLQNMKFPGMASDVDEKGAHCRGEGRERCKPHQEPLSLGKSNQKASRDKPCNQMRLHHAQ